jgi:hypothetical protein
MLDIGKHITDDYYGKDGNGYDQLADDWALYYKIARYFIHKVKHEDKYDFLQDLMLEMAKVKAKYKAKASYFLARLW